MTNILNVLVVTGSRAWPCDQDHIVLDKLRSYPRDTLCIVGDCPPPKRGDASSVDDLVLRVFSLPYRNLVPAFWEKHGPAAGPIRNTEIVRRAKYYLDGGCRVAALAFPLDGGPRGGTWDCIRKLRRIGVEPEITEAKR